MILEFFRPCKFDSIWKYSIDEVEVRKKIVDFCESSFELMLIFKVHRIFTFLTKRKNKIKKKRKERRYATHAFRENSGEEFRCI